MTTAEFRGAHCSRDGTLRSCGVVMGVVTIRTKADLNNIVIFSVESFVEPYMDREANKASCMDCVQWTKKHNESGLFCMHMVAATHYGFSWHAPAPVITMFA